MPAGRSYGSRVADDAAAEQSENLNLKICDFRREERRASYPHREQETHAILVSVRPPPSNIVMYGVIPFSIYRLTYYARAPLLAGVLLPDACRFVAGCLVGVLLVQVSDRGTAHETSGSRRGNGGCTMTETRRN